MILRSYSTGIALIAIPLGAVLIVLDVRFGLMFAFGLISFSFYLRDNLAYYYLAIPTIILFRNFGISLPFPFLSSPVDLLVTLAIGIGILRAVVTKKPLPTSRLYLLILAFVSIAFIQVILLKQNDSVHLNSVEKLIRGLWPFFLIILLLETPRQARNVVLVLGGTALLAMILWLPNLIFSALSGNMSAFRGIDPALTGNFFFDLAATNSLRTYLFVVPFSTFGGIAIAFIIIKSSHRLWSAMGLIAITIYTLSTGIASGIISLLASLLVAFLLSIFIDTGDRKKINHSQRVLGALLIIFLLGFLVLLFAELPAYRSVIERVLSPNTDASASSRLSELSHSGQIILDNPLFGAYDDSYWYGGHDSIITYTANWGGIFSIPYFATLLIIAFNGIQLARRSISDTEKATLIGIVSVLLANVIASIATPNVIEFFADLVIWTFAGLIVVWGSWVKRDPDAHLIA